MVSPRSSDSTSVALRPATSPDVQQRGLLAVRRLLGAGLGIGLALVASGCASRTWRQSDSIFQAGGVTVELEQRFVDGEPEDRFDHPVTIDAALIERALLDLRFESAALFGKSDPAPILDPGVANVTAESIAAGLSRASNSERVRFRVRGSVTSLYVLPTTASTRGVAFVSPAGSLNLVFDAVQRTPDPNDPGRDARWDDPTSRQRGAARVRLILPAYAEYGRDDRETTHPLWASLSLGAVAALPAEPSSRVVGTTSRNESTRPAVRDETDPATESLTDSEILARLRFLEELHREGRIDDEQYEAKRAELLSPRN